LLRNEHWTLNLRRLSVRIVIRHRIF
jgi:hypothetical protein